ncbi:amino acid ABC transporter substrate-binding protein [Phototrophicus methaneseepsis]|uniref:Amino acid ABC transporter substrate-binding protein n=1 Tax=Phototrophicus methaneseepsis TaxID=2710758 RepID=A0A7S8ICT2_9CHLR|nr:ABC transporter substrate-binding protein [Phototrophicus methaneseepsis]QPC80806.1 amino acid ABC transporter substrate-binding protein [Phototrophicus methaneseepsis]
MVSTAHHRRTLIALAIIVSVAFALIWRSLNTPTVDQPLEAGATLRVGIDPSLPPFATIHDNALAGFEIDLANALAAELDLTVHFVVLGFDSLYDALLTEQVDCLIATLVIDASRMDDVRYTRPYYDDGLQLVATHSDFIQQEALTRHVLAFEFGSEADSLARQWSIQLADLTQRPYERPEYALDAVITDEAHAALVDQTSFLLYTPPNDVSLYAASITSVPFAIATRRERPALTKQLDQALDSLQQSGEITVLIEKWF